MLPAAKAVPKEMLPVVDRPAIQYVVEEAVAAGCDDVLLIVSNDKKAVEDHFDRHGELEARLAEKGRSDWLKSVTDLRDKASIFSVRQHEQLGLGHAVLQAERHIGNQPFLCLLGDAVFPPSETGPAQQLAAVHAEHGGSVIGLERVPRDKLNRYGVAGGTMRSEGVMKLDQLVEKPDPADAPSDLAVAARYLLSPTIFKLLRDTPRGAGNEIQLTDAIQALIQAEPVHGVVLNTPRHDVGNPLDWLKANLAFAARDASLRDDLATYTRELFTSA